MLTGAWAGLRGHYGRSKHRFRRELGQNVRLSVSPASTVAPRMTEPLLFSCRIAPSVRPAVARFPPMH